MMKTKKPILFRIFYRVIKMFFPRFQVEKKTDLNAPGHIYVSNHAQAYGPLAMYFYFPQKRYIWTIGEMCNRKEVTSYAMEDFWRHKSKWTKWIYKLFSFIILAPLGSYLLKTADTIPVYKDSRLRQTMSKSIDKLNEGNDIIIFPEYRDLYNKYINEFQINFVDVGRFYTRRTNIDLSFYPVYTCVDLRKILIGEPTKFNSHANIDEERMRIVRYLQDEITKLGESLPNHTIVPYINNKRKYRQKSKE